MIFHGGERQGESIKSQRCEEGLCDVKEFQVLRRGCLIFQIIYLVTTANAWVGSTFGKMF